MLLTVETGCEPWRVKTDLGYNRRKPQVLAYPVLFIACAAVARKRRVKKGVTDTNHNPSRRSRTANKGQGRQPLAVRSNSA